MAQLRPDTVFARKNSYSAPAEIEFVQASDEDHVRLGGDAGVVLATDRPVLERGYIDDRYQTFYLSLNLTAGAIKRWREDGTLAPDGSLVMLRDHGSSWSTKLTDAVGRWENLRVEQRDGHRALVADPAFDPALMGAWMVSAGMEPEAWRGLLRRRSISRTSIRYRAASPTLKRVGEVDGAPHYRADFQALEASWVWNGADSMAGMDRATKVKDMDPKEVQALVDAAVAQALEQQRSAAPAPEPKIEVEAAPALEARAEWQALVTVVYREMGAEAPSAIEAARADQNPVAALTTALATHLQSRSQGNATPPAPAPAPVPAPLRATGGMQQGYGHLQDLMTVFRGRAADAMQRRPRDLDKDGNPRPGTPTALKEEWIAAARKVTPLYQSIGPERFLIAAARDLGYIETSYLPTDMRELMTVLAGAMRAPEQALSSPMGGRYLPTDGAVRSASGQVDIVASMRAGSGLVPADLPAVYTQIPMVIMLPVHETAMIDIRGLANDVTLSYLENQKLVRYDAAVNFNKVTGDQNLPEAQVWDEEVDIDTAARGVTYASSWEAMFSRGGAMLAVVPMLLGMRFAGAEIAEFFRVMRAGLYKGSTIYTGDHTATEDDLALWFQAVRNTAALARPVPLPAGGLQDGVSADVPGVGMMRPDALVVSGTLDRKVSDYFAPRQAIQTGNNDKAHTQFELELARGLAITDYITQPEMYALVTSGPAATMTVAGLAGQGLNVTSRDDTDIRQLPNRRWRIYTTFQAHVTHRFSGYRNTVTP